MTYCKLPNGVTLRYQIDQEGESQFVARLWHVGNRPAWMDDSPRATIEAKSRQRARRLLSRDIADRARCNPALAAA